MTDAASDGAVLEDLTVSLIAAVAENRVIGVDGEMPWHYPADLRHFKETTTGHPVIMGRRTYESIVARIGGPLPGRTNIVLSSRDRDYDEDVRVVDSVAAALAEAEDALTSPSRTAASESDTASTDFDTTSTDSDTTSTDSDTAYVIGGASIYEQFLPLADRLIITEIPVEPDGDTVFPAWDPAQWQEVNREQDGELAFVTYERRE